MSYYRADNKDDIATVALALEHVPPVHRPYLAAAIVNNDLMRGPLWFQALVGLIRLRGNSLQRLLGLYIKFPDLADDLLKQAAHHILNGIDQEDVTSVGGFSQREMDLIIADLWKIGAK